MCVPRGSWRIESSNRRGPSRGAGMSNQPYLCPLSASVPPDVKEKRKTLARTLRPAPALARQFPPSSRARVGGTCPTVLQERGARGCMAGRSHTVSGRRVRTRTHEGVMAPTRV